MKRLTQLSVAVSAVLLLATTAFAQQGPEPQPKPQAGPGCDLAAVQCSMEQKPHAQKPANKMKKVKKPMRAQSPHPNAAQPAPTPFPLTKPAVPTAP